MTEALPAPVAHPSFAGKPVATPTVPARKGEFLQAVQSASQAATPSAAIGPKLVPHPFYEGEMYDPAEAAAFFGKDGLDFGDLLDVINPLQHIPIVSALYRKLTGDEISPASRLAGGALFGGPLGLAGAYLTGVIEETTGKSIGESVLAFLTGDDAISEQTAASVASIAPAAGNGNAAPSADAIAWTTPRMLNAAASAADTSTAAPSEEAVPAGSIAWTTPRVLGAPGALAVATPKPVPHGLGKAAIAAPPAATAAAATNASVLHLAAARQGLKPVDLLAERTPSPLAFARSLLQSSPSGGIPTPPPAATKAIIAAEERERQQEKGLPDPVSAVLAARSQVPRAGTVRGLDARRMSPQLAPTPPALASEPLAAPTSAVERGDGGDSPSAGQFVRRPDARAGLARQEAPVPVEGKRGVPPPRQSASALESARRRAAATPVPNAMVPKAMMNALEKYETMVQDRNAAVPSVAPDLTL